MSEKILSPDGSVALGDLSNPVVVRGQASVKSGATPYPAAPITANGGAADADGSDTAFGVACTMVTVDSDEDVYIANSELEAEAAADGTAWGRIFHRGGTAKEYPWGDSGGAATRAFWAQKISTDATVNVVGWAE